MCLKGNARALHSLVTVGNSSPAESISREAFPSKAKPHTTQANTGYSAQCERGVYYRRTVCSEGAGRVF